MSRNLQPRQFYNKMSDKYDVGMSVSPETFGLQQASVGDGVRRTPVEPHEVDVPISQVRARQGYVYDKHVQNLATVPQSSFHEIHAVPSVSAHHNGTYLLNEGHHRAAAAIVRGDDTLRVQVTGRWDPSQ